MALDGIVIHNLAKELQANLIGGKIDKVNQPEKDELILHIRSNKQKFKLLLTAQASMPRIHFTSLQKNNPPTPSAFCMLLRKHIGSGRIMDVAQLESERIIDLTIEQRNEMGDLCRYHLLIEIMGKHSNIILTDEKGKILESIKRIGAHVSSIRQVFPGITYMLPPNQEKKNPFNDISFEEFSSILYESKTALYKSLYTSFQGLSPLLANYMCNEANLASDDHVSSLTSHDMSNLFRVFVNTLGEKIETKSCYIFTDCQNQYEDFHIVSDVHPHLQAKEYSTISEAIDEFFKTQSLQTRMRQKTIDLRKLVQTSLERCYKKLDIQEHQLQDTKNMEKFKIKGELILANQYMIKKGDTSVDVLDYYTNTMKKISLDKDLSAIENANKAFDKYNKKKRTKEATHIQLEHTRTEILHLESIKYTLDHITTAEDIHEVRRELMNTGYIKFRKDISTKKAKSKPHHYLSSDGYHMYVGRNNYQNDELTMNFAKNNDWWFHTKEVPGSHVIVKSQGVELPDKVYEEAAALAAFYSKAKNDTKVTVDYTLKKHLKKPNSAVPGYVIYHTNYSLYSS